MRPLSGGGLLDQVRELRDLIPAGDPVTQVRPERDPVFAAGLFQADEGIATSSPVLAAGAGADLALLDHVAQVVLAAVVMQGQIRVVQHPQQFVPVALEALEDWMERFAGGDRGAQGVELGVDRGFGRRRRLLPVGRQVPIQRPDLLLDPGNGLPVGRIERQQVLQGALGMHPAQGVDEQGKLPGVIAQQA